MFKLLVLDVDGVLTDGKKIVDYRGYTHYKQFDDKNWTAIKKFVACGIPVVVISGDPWNKNIFENRNIPFYCSKGNNGILDKAQFLPILEKTYSVESGEICFCGDDFFDLDLMQLIGFPFCPRDANTDVLKYCLETYAKDFQISYAGQVSIDNKRLVKDCPYISNKNGGDAIIDDLFYLSVDIFGLKVPDNLNVIVREIDSREK